MLRDTASVCGMVLVLLSDPIGQAAAKTPGPAELIGTWRGTSTCTDRVAAPACNDETVVYEFSAGSKPGLLHWKADKIVNGQREAMGEFDLAYDKTEACWKAEYRGPRVTIVWRLTVKDRHLTGTGRQLPGNQTIRKIDLVPMAPVQNGYATARQPPSQWRMSTPRLVSVDGDARAGRRVVPNPHGGPERSPRTPLATNANPRGFRRPHAR